MAIVLSVADGSVTVHWSVDSDDQFVAGVLTFFAVAAAQLLDQRIDPLPQLQRAVVLRRQRRCAQREGPDPERHHW